MFTTTSHTHFMCFVISLISRKKYRYKILLNFSSTFRRKKVELLSSLRRQCQHLGRLSFLSESISQKLSKVSIWNLKYLFTIKRGTNYKIQFLNNYDRHWNETQHTVICSLSNGEPITTRQVTLRFVYPELSALVLA